MAPLSNIRREKFAHEVARGGKSDGQCYIDAGYKPKDEGSAKSAAHTLKNVDEVAARIAELRAPVIKEFEVTTTGILRKLAIIASGDVRKVMKWSKRKIEAISSQKLTADEAAMISEVSKLPDGTVVVKLHRPETALRLLGQHMGLFSGESAAAASVTVNNDNRTVVFVERPPQVTREQWIAQRTRSQPGQPALAGPAVGAPARSSNGRH